MTPMPESRERVRREVVSFVRRSSRMTDSQARAWHAHAPKWVIEVPTRQTSTSISPDAAVDWEREFGRSAPLVVEIGPGKGEALLSAAQRHPDRNFIGFEVYQPAVAAILVRLAKNGIGNVRLIMADGVAGLSTLIPPAALAELWTFFPDPWHKSNHHKRRLVNPGFADLVASRLAPGGVWRLATDWENYARTMRGTLDGHPGLVNVHDGWAPRWDGRPLTRYEERGLAAGRAIKDLTYRRVDAP